MHLLAVQPGDISDGSEAVDLGQSGGDIVVLSAADTDLALLADARRQMPEDYPELRLANFLQLQHNLSVDLYIESVIEGAKLVCVRLLGGTRYWPYGIAEIRRVCAARRIPLAIVPGDGNPDTELESWSTLDRAAYERLWLYLVYGGRENGAGLLRYAASLLGREMAWREPAPLPAAGLYWPGRAHPSLDDMKAEWREGAPAAYLVFYRALVLSGSTEPVDAAIAALQAEGLNPLPVFVQSLKDGFSIAVLEQLLDEAAAGIVLNMTSFAVAVPGEERRASVFEAAGCPVLQLVLSAQNEARWRESVTGLSARDIAMNVALPEVDGRIITRAAAFKAETEFDEATQSSITRHRAEPGRMAFIAGLAANWCRLARTDVKERRAALVLANYPNRDGRIGNGVGLDTPESTVNLLRFLKQEGYGVENLPENGTALMAQLAAGPTNDLTARPSREGGAFLPLETYEALFKALPEVLQAEVTARWGGAADDPFVEEKEGARFFRLPVLDCGKVQIGIQPARGYNIDPKGSYHDPALVPPHSYFAFYMWLRDVWGAQAFIHMGKHGTLEWLPGKAAALSESCYPEAVFGAMPHLYPFIVNDPGEGTQAKRRAQAVIIDHMTPPLTRAETYGPLKELEALVDEYYEAAMLDPRRMALLSNDILDLARSAGLDKDCGFGEDASDEEALAALDNYLCELKEMQIRDGLHVFGSAPEGRQKRATLVALLRAPRGLGREGDASILRALAEDLQLEDIDPLSCEMGGTYDGPRPAVLEAYGEGIWRSNGDTVERLEGLAADLVSGAFACPASWRAVSAVLVQMREKIEPALQVCGAAELAGAAKGLAGRFVEPGPSGAPTRGRPDVLPTGRNFYSVDTRAVPTDAAWRLGWESAQLLVEDFRQRQGRWPQVMALSAWGTANMRTGGDDIAQALALIGARPKWEPSTGRVTGFEVLPLAVLGRPRVDVTFRISGFFRDAFPAQIDLLDSALRAVMALEEEESENPLAARYRQEMAAEQQGGTSTREAAHKAGLRIFGSKPGAYGAGLQALIDERLWEERSDFAAAYLEWGSYAYGNGAEGARADAAFRQRLSRVEVVVQNQDNREHDLLDSDDYYQFQGGIASAVAHLKGEEPVLYHNDHSRPETPRIRLLEDEIGRVVRARAANPKWIEAAMRHGYKGAYEMAATVDYLFAFAASTRVVKSHHFDLLFDAYLGDEAVRDFLATHNPAAMREMAERFEEARTRGLWQAQRNSAAPLLDMLTRNKREMPHGEG
ncbi:cobaltochelatase subunit CobN [Tepidicaulis sp. LMO-SS28]|uniref:cobaltochelatase subunit CobN n=1 Tax=Tepidicaulis sp. LMO-SS28 TaxID=3447455 RepID=UPI003EDFE121